MQSAAVEVAEFAEAVCMLLKVEFFWFCPKVFQVSVPLTEA